MPYALPPAPTTTPPAAVALAWQRSTVLPEIIAETERSGWPHYPSTPERLAVARFILSVAVPEGRAGRVLCRFGATMGRGYCGVQYGTRRARRSFRVNWRAWEDGSVRGTIAPRATRTTD